MPPAPLPTVFITRADGFIGCALVRVLTRRGHAVFALAPSAETAKRVRSLGATPVNGDLIRPGAWQDEAAADWIFHVAPCAEPRRSMNPAGAASVAHARVSADRRLLDVVAAGATRRIVYVADACCYGTTGARPITEDAPLQPSIGGRSYVPALDRLDGYLVAGLPIVTALPGLVYGNASWFRKRVIEPVLTGRRVVQFGKALGWVSPIHVEDCARALVHLAEHGHAGSRYFLVNNEPIQMHEFADTFARLAQRLLRVWRVPRVAARLLVEPVLADYILGDGIFSNIRLRGSGFRFAYPSLEQGMQQIVEALHE